MYEIDCERAIFQTFWKLHSVFLTFSFRILQNCCKKHQRPFQTNFNEPYKNSFAFSQIEATASLGNLSDIPFLPNRRDLPARPQLLCSQSNYDSQSSGTKGFWKKKNPSQKLLLGCFKKANFSNVHFFGIFSSLGLNLLEITLLPQFFVF